MSRANASLHGYLVDEVDKHVSLACTHGSAISSTGISFYASTKGNWTRCKEHTCACFVHKPSVAKLLDVPWLCRPLMDRPWTVKDRIWIGPRLRQLDSKRHEDGRRDRRNEMSKRTWKRRTRGNEAQAPNPCDLFRSCTGLGNGMAAMEARRSGRRGEQERSRKDRHGAPAARNHGGDPRRRVQDGKRPSTSSTRR